MSTADMKRMMKVYIYIYMMIYLIKIKNRICSKATYIVKDFKQLSNQFTLLLKKNNELIAGVKWNICWFLSSFWTLNMWELLLLCSQKLLWIKTLISKRTVQSLFIIDINWKWTLGGIVCGIFLLSCYNRI